MSRNSFRQAKQVLPVDTITFSHNDLDGVGVGVVVKSINGRTAEVAYCSYDNVDDKINARLDEIQKRYTDSLPFILIADLGIKDATAERLNNYGGGALVLDHHKTNQPLADKYEWFNVDESKCGTLQVYEYFARTTKMGEFATLVDDYDRWIHNDPRSKKHNQLFFMRSYQDTEDRWLNNPSADFTLQEEAVLEMEARRIEKHFDRLEKVTEIFDLEDGNKFGIVYCDNYQSETGHELLNRLGLSVIIMIDPNNRKISLRSVPNFDVTPFAKAFGGGGHKNAAGANFKGTFHVVETAIEAVYETIAELFIDEYDDDSAKEFEVMFGIGKYADGASND